MRNYIIALPLVLLIVGIVGSLRGLLIMILWNLVAHPLLDVAPIHFGTAFILALVYGVLVRSKYGLLPIKNDV